LIIAALSTAQLYPSESQKNYNSFFIKKFYDGKGKELESPEGAGRGKGVRNHVVVSTLCREATLRNPGFPLDNRNYFIKK